MNDFLSGRLLTRSEIKELPKEYMVKAGMREHKNKITCNRCNSKHNKSDVKLRIDAYYCPDCINLGRVRSDEYLYYRKQENFQVREKSVLLWQGKLTNLQGEVAEKLRTAVDNEENIWIHAVTGAGKTEMIYELVADFINKGKRVGIASPRVDVCIELYKRMVRDFDLDIALLHAEGDEYFMSQLTILTTYQLLRFYEAFDLLIIDEVDAFPYVDNDMLYFATERAKKKTSSLIYLTATSTKKLEKAVKRKELQKVSLARRFHNNPLVVPKFYFLQMPYNLKKIPKKLLKMISKQRKSGYPLLLFVPIIQVGEDIVNLMKEEFSTEIIESVSSISADRKEKVEKFREGKINILITTTILERGVTFPKVDVFILYANHRLFTSSSLIQIAGRTGRSMERPTGLVYFFHNGVSKAMKGAVREIKYMNKLGGF